MADSSRRQGEQAAASPEDPLDLCFKGERNYLHGTDIYCESIRVAGSRWPLEAAQCRLVFHRPAFYPLGIRWVHGDSVASSNPVAALRIVREDGIVFGRIMERPGSVDCRIPYDEEAIVSGAVLQDRSIHLQRPPSSNHAIEVIVALCKRLHLRHFEPDQGSRWLFSRLDLDRPLEEREHRPIGVTLRTPVRPVLTKSTLTIGTEPVGSIYFSVGQL